MTKPIILKGSTKLLRPAITQLMATHQLLSNKDVGEVYGIPKEEYDSVKEYKPVVFLYFKEKDEVNPNNFRPVKGYVSFKLIDSTSETINTGKINNIANKIKTTFATGTPYIWKKGRKLAKYVDVEKGYFFSIFCLSKGEGRDLIQAVLSIQNDLYAEKNLNMQENESEGESYPATPGNITILGETDKRPRARPIVDVHFQYATLSVWAKKRSIILVDISGKYSNPIVM